MLIWMKSLVYMCQRIWRECLVYGYYKAVENVIYDYIINVDVYLYNNYNIIMEEIKFEWDENKNDINKKKHKLSYL